MRHNEVTWETDLNKGDIIFYCGKWVEIYHISEDNGIHLSSGPWVCRSDLNYTTEDVEQFS